VFGPFDSRRTPFMRGILDEFTNPDTETISVRAPRQLVKTTVMLIEICRSIHVDPCSMLLIEPTLDLAESVSKRRLQPAFRDVQVLADLGARTRSRDSENTILKKTFPNGAGLTLAGANSTSGLISEPRKKIFYDEVDYYAATIGQMGDPIATSLQCAITFWDRKICYMSRPSVKGISRIDACIDASDERYFLVPCHACGQGQKLEFEQVRCQDKDPATAVYLCKFCGEAWNDAQRVENMMNAESLGWGWRGERAFSGHAGFTLNGVYHVWRPLSRFMKNFFDANVKNKQGNKQPLRDWENDEFGRSWEEDAETIAAQPLLERREAYGAKRLPWPILYLTAGVDVQDNRIEVEVVGWRAVNREENVESWGVEDLVFYFDKPAAKNESDSGDDVPLTSKATWDQLDLLKSKVYRTQDGRELRITAMCIDSGGHRTNEVYRYCNRRITRNIYAVKGADGSRTIWPRRASKSIKQKGSLLWIVGVDTAKDAIYNSLRVNAHGPGYAHFPETYQLEYFEQLTSERVGVKFRNGRPYRYWYKPASVANEALDRRVYALAALYSKPVPWEILAKSAPSEPPPAPPTDGGRGGEPALSKVEGPSAAPAAAQPNNPPNPNLGGRRVRFKFGR
jgi:phage terminase large subunit GpA-like protein